jgi:hypothetical protein
MSQQQQDQQQQEQQEQQEQDEYQNEIMDNEIMDKLKIDILNMYKKIKMYRRGAYAPPLPPSVKGGVIGERSSPKRVRSHRRHKHPRLVFEYLQHYYQ